VQLLHSPARTRAVFDDPNLLPNAGLTPLLALADGAGLPDLLAGSATSPARKTSPWSGSGTRPASWQPSAARPSACRAWTATTTSPPPTATTPAIPSGR
jgi:hypothetical protein